MPRAQRGTVKPAFGGPQSASGDQHCQQASSGQEDCPPQGEEVSSCGELTSPSSSTRCCLYRGDPGTEVGLATLKPQLGEGRQESLSSWGPHCVLPLLVKQRELYSSLALPRFYKRRARPSRREATTRLAALLTALHGPASPAPVSLQWVCEPWSQGSSPSLQLQHLLPGAQSSPVSLQVVSAAVCQRAWDTRRVGR